MQDTKVILDILGTIRPEAGYSTSDDFISDGLLDSFDIVTLIAELDRAHSISIDGLDIVPENFANVRTIESLLHKNGVA